MATCPQDYVSDRGRLTTNTVEGFHGLALMYRTKRTDLHHAHYICKTNMAICHKVSIARGLQSIMLYTVNILCIHTYLIEPGSCLEGINYFVLASMGVDIPLGGVNSILTAQANWEKNCVKRSTKEKLHQGSDVAL